MSDNKSRLTSETVKKIVEKADSDIRKNRPRRKFSPIPLVIACLIILSILDEVPYFETISSRNMSEMIRIEAGVETDSDKEKGTEEEAAEETGEEIQEETEEETTAEETTEPESTQEQTAGKLRITASSLNVRETPGGDVIGSLREGDEVAFYELTEDGWYRIGYEDGEGYVHQDYVVPLE